MCALLVLFWYFWLSVCLVWFSFFHSFILYFLRKREKEQGVGWVESLGGCGNSWGEKKEYDQNILYEKNK